MSPPLLILPHESHRYTPPDHHKTSYGSEEVGQRTHTAADPWGTAMVDIGASLLRRKQTVHEQRLVVHLQGACKVLTVCYTNISLSSHRCTVEEQLIAIGE